MRLVRSSIILGLFIAALFGVLINGSALAAPLDVGVVPSFVSINLVSGQKQTIDLKVYNKNGTDTASFHAYAVPTNVKADGSYVFEGEEIPPLPMQNYIKINPDRFEIPAGESKTISIDIDVPTDAAPSANQLMLFVENITSLSDPSPGVHVTGRIGVPFFSLINLSSDSAKNLKPRITEQWMDLSYRFRPLLSRKDGHWKWDWSAYGRPTVTSTIHLQNDGTAYAMVAGITKFEPTGFLGFAWGGKSEEKKLTPKYVSAKGGTRDIVENWDVTAWFGHLDAAADLTIQDAGEIHVAAQAFIIPWLHVITLIVVIILWAAIRWGFKKSWRALRRIKTSTGDVRPRLVKEPAAAPIAFTEKKKSTSGKKSAKEKTAREERLTDEE